MSIRFRLFRSACSRCLGFIAFVVVQDQFAFGQLIGNQNIGVPALSLTQQRAAAIAPGASGGIGAASNAIGSVGNRLQVNNTRFVRGNRNRQDFVGSNRTDQTGFVGAGQALGVGRVQSAAEGLRIETTKTKINRPLPQQPANGMYYPRLEVDLGNEGLSLKAQQKSQASLEAINRVAYFSGGTAEITMAGNTAILKGSVNSKRTSDLLMQILSFEPGIDGVKNELEIRQ